jgi:hypothetical protein
MVATFEGWQFKLEFRDRSKEFRLRRSRGRPVYERLRRGASRRANSP